MKESTRRAGLATRIFKVALGIAFVSVLGLIALHPPPALAEDDPPTGAAGASGKEQKEETAAADQVDPSGQPEAQEEKVIKAYPVLNGTASYGRTEEVEKKKTADGEIETRRVRAPAYAGDRSVLRETEVRTKRLPDGTTEKEYVLRNPDGAGRMVPIEIIREKTRTDGGVTTTDREVLRP